MERNYKRKKRSCGCCKQCLVKHDCGECSFCINKKTWKQKCILRRCSQMQKAAVNPYLEPPRKKWLVTMQLSYKIIEACYNLQDGDQHEILDSVFDSIFISREDDKIAIELEDSASIVLTKTRPQTHSFVDIGYSTDYWIRNRKIADLKPSESVDNVIKNIKLERVENISFGDEDASLMSPVDYHEESETECEDNAADNIEQVSFNDNQVLPNEIVSIKMETASVDEGRDEYDDEEYDQDNYETNEGIPFRQDDYDSGNHEGIHTNKTKTLSQDETESDQGSIDGKQEGSLTEDKAESSQDGVVTKKKEKLLKKDEWEYDQDNVANEKRSLSQDGSIHDPGNTDNNQRRRPRRVSKGVLYWEDDMLTDKSEETDDNVVDDDNDDENYVPTRKASAEEYSSPRKRSKIFIPKESNMLNAYMIKAECPVCKLWYKYSRTGILRHLKVHHLDIPNQFEEQFKEEMRHHKPSEDERVMCDICETEVDQSFAPLHFQYEHSESMYPQSQIALAKYYNLRCKSSQPMATKTAKYKFNLLFEKLTSKIETAVCEYCNTQFSLKKMEKHHMKCKKSPGVRKFHYCVCGFRSAEYVKVSEHKATCTKINREVDDNSDDDSNDETYVPDGEENTEKSEKKCGKTHKELGDGVNMLNVYMIKAECPICQTWYKYSRTGILRHLKVHHLDIPNKFEEEFRDEMRHHKPSEDERVICDICETEVDQSFAPLHIQYEHSESMYPQSQIALAKYYKLRSKSSQPLATKTAKYNFNILYEKLTSKIETAVCKFCNVQFSLKKMEKHHMKCKKNPYYKKQRYCECGYRSIDYEKLSQHKAMCTKKRRLIDHEGDDNVVDDDNDKNYKPEGDKSEDEYQGKFVKTEVHEESEDIATMAEDKQVQLEQVEKIKAVKGRRENMLNIYMIKTKCPICKLWYKYSRSGILRHLKISHLQVPNQVQLMTQYKDEIRLHTATENEKVKCDMCDLELDQSFAPLHIQFEHSEYKYPQSQMALARYYKLRCKSSQPLTSKTATYKFSLLFEKLTSSIETVVCEFCGEKFSMKKMEKHHLNCKKNPERRKYFHCVCGFKSLDSTRVKNHKTTCNHKPQNVLCDYCGKSCKSFSNYFKHRKFDHGIQTKYTTVIKDYPCDQCDKVYHLPSRLKNHIQSTHSKIKDYICEICARAFRFQNSLNRHIEFAHHNIYRFYCEKCGHGMNKKSLVKTHVCGRVRKRKKLHEYYTAHLEEENEASKPKPKQNKYRKMKKLQGKEDQKPAAAASASTSRQEASESYEPYSVNMDMQSNPSSGFVETSNQTEMLYHNQRDQKEVLFDNQPKESAFDNRDSFMQRSLEMGAAAGLAHENMYLPMQNPYINMHPHAPVLSHLPPHAHLPPPPSSDRLGLPHYDMEPRNYSTFNINH